MSSSSVALKSPRLSERLAGRRASPPPPDAGAEPDLAHYDIFITGAAIAIILIGLMILR
ncbi:MAG TPA: hypothetical protein VEL07_10535 [Planctomycetota bacterium]|nr:hypothetical protein [Planctomycetota bacterium]